MELRRNGVAAIAMGLLVVSLAGCGSSGETAAQPSANAVSTTASVADATTTSDGDISVTTAVSTTTADSSAGAIIPAEAYFAACLDVAGVPHDDSVWSQFPPPSNASGYVPTEPTAVFGPPGENWWAVLFADDAAAVNSGLIFHVPSGLLSNPHGRMLRVGAATESGVPADASADQQAVATVIQECSLEAIGGEGEARQLPGS
jgi:hypothetical protein